MNIPKKIIDEVAEQMFANRIYLEDIAMVPNVFLIYLHRDDYAGIRFLLNTLREQIIVRLNKEIAKREKKSPSNKGKVNKLLKFLAGFKVIENDQKLVVPEDWDISFQATDREVLVGNEVYEINKGEICVVASFSGSVSSAGDLASHLKTFVTIYKTDGRNNENSLPETARPETPKPHQMPVQTAQSFVKSGLNRLAVVNFKYNGAAAEDMAETFEMSKDTIIIGRDPSADIILSRASDRISRKHVEITYKNNKFFLKSFGIYGTTVQGKPVPMSEKVIDYTTQKLDKEIELPDQARIALAGGEVLIDFMRGVSR